MMLTARQRELLLYIERYAQEHGIPPSFDEMRTAMGLKSKSGIHRLVQALEERRFIRRLPNRARAIEILRQPAGSASSDSANDNGTERRAPRKQVAAAPLFHLPLVGRIAAGLPIEAIEEQEEISIPSDLVGSGDHYALKIAGDSMQEAGILDGDFVLIRRTSQAEEGEIVVALIDDENATLKYFHKENGTVCLKPANHSYTPQYYPVARVRIQGVLAGLLRRYSG